MLDRPPGELLNENQKRGLTATLQHLEKALRQVEGLLDGGDSGALYETVDLPSEEDREALRGLVAEARAAVAELALAFELERHRESARSAIVALTSGGWEDLESCRPSALRGYGAVDPGLEAALGPRIERLSKLMRRMMNTAGRPRGKPGS